MRSPTTESRSQPGLSGAVGSDLFGADWDGRAGELAQQCASLSFGFQAVRLLHWPEAADHVGQFGSPLRRPAYQDEATPVTARISPMYCSISARSIRRSCCRPNMSNAVPRKMLAVAQHAEQRQRQPARQCDLPAPSCRRIDAAPQRRRKMEYRLLAVSSQQRADARPRIRPCMP